MATIVTQYDPWREKLAAGLGVNLLSDAIQRSQAADAQRKNNAVYAETLKSLGLMGDEQEQSLYDPLLSSQVTPEGYNNNGWAKTMHDSYTPMTQFNLGTSGITQPASTNKNLGQLDYITALAKTINSDPKRFGGVDFSNIYTNMLKPTMEADAADYATQLATQQRTRQLDLASALSNAKTPQERALLLEYGMAGGILGDKVSGSLVDLYKQNNPNYKNIEANLGGQTLLASFDPLTGQYSPQAFFDNSLSPDQKAKTDFDYYKTNTENALRQAELGAKYDEFGLKYGQSGQENFMKFQKQVDEQLSKDEESLREEIARIIQDAEDTTDPKTKAKIDSALTVLRASLEQTRQKRQAIRNSLIAMYHGGQQGDTQTTHLASSILGFNVRPSKNGEFGNNRGGGHTHAGTDYGAPEGSSVTINPRMGDNLTVSYVGKDERKVNGKTKGYGNYFIIEGERGGQRVEYLFGHLQDGGIKVKQGQQLNAGDVAALTGNTGGSTGPHLHVEVRVGGEKGKVKSGKLVNPDTFFADYPFQQQTQQQTPQVVPLAVDQPTSQTEQQTQTPQGEGQKTTQQQSATQFDNTRPVLVNDKGETLTEAQLVVLGDGDISKGIQLAVQKGFRGYQDKSAGHGLAYNPLYEFGGTPKTGASIGDYIQAIPEAIMRGIESIGNSSAYQSIANLGNDKTALQFDFPDFSNIIDPISQAFSNWRDIERNPQQRGREPSQVPEQVSAQVPISTQTPAQNTTPATAPQFEISDINRFTQYGDNPAWGNFIPNAVDNFAEFLTKNPSTNPLYEFTSENTFTPPSAIEADYSDLINTIRQTASNWSGINRTPQRRGSEIKEPQEDSTQYVDISQKPETWQDPDALLRRSYMQTGGEQSLLDKLNGDNDPIRFIWDGIPSTGAPLWDPPQRTGKPEVTFEGPIGQFHRLSTPWGAGISDDKRPSMGMQSAPMTVEQLIGLQSDPLASSAWSNPMPYDPLYMGNNSDDINAFREFMDALTLSRWINSRNAINGFYSRFRGR